MYLQDVKTQKNKTNIFTAVRTSLLTQAVTNEFISKMTVLWEIAACSLVEV
jgi:hypothetical protein